MPFWFVIILEQSTLQKVKLKHHCIAGYLRKLPLDLTVCLTQIAVDELLSPTETDQLEALCLKNKLGFNKSVPVKWKLLCVEINMKEEQTTGFHEKLLRSVLALSSD